MVISHLYCSFDVTHSHREYSRGDNFLRLIDSCTDNVIRSEHEHGKRQ
jgi:hypothetical protein